MSLCIDSYHVFFMTRVLTFYYGLTDFFFRSTDNFVHVYGFGFVCVTFGVLCLLILEIYA